MGMFDWYEPDGAFTCPTCGSQVAGWPTDSGPAWQGKDGPCWRFVWKQGCRHPVRHAVNDEDMLITDLSGEVLPREFALYAQCPDGHWIDAVGRCDDSGIWNETLLATQ